MKVGEDGLVPRTGAEFMALETTAEAGTCLAWRSMLGLVGSSMKGIEAKESSVVAKGATFLPGRSPLASGSGDSLPNPRFICLAGVSWTLRPVGGFCLKTTSSR